MDEDSLLPSLEQCRILARLNKCSQNGISWQDVRWASESGDYCIYCLCENGRTVRYIGITNQTPASRLAQHFSDCGRGKNAHKENWLSKCRRDGIPVTINVIRGGLTSTRAGLIEVELIRFFKKAFRLTNTHAGGATGYAGLSEESKEKHRRAMHEAWGPPNKIPFLPALMERKSRAKSEKGRRMASRRWELDGERRELLAAQELNRQKRLVVILRDTETGEERVIPYRDFSPGRVYVTARKEW